MTMTRLLVIAGFAVALLAAQAARAPEARCDARWCPNVQCINGGICGSGCACLKQGGESMGRCVSLSLR
jgi:hypothetical protein